MNHYDRAVVAEENPEKPQKKIRGKVLRGAFGTIQFRQKSVNRVSEVKIEAGSLAELNQWIPAWLSSLSLARGQIVVDQIRGFLEKSKRCEGFRRSMPDTSISSPLVFLISTDSNGQRCAVLAAQSFSVPSGHFGAHGSGNSRLETGVLGDSATILHAGAWGDPTQKMPDVSLKVPDLLVSALDDTLARQGAKFLQWATDGGTQNNASVTEACRAFGMRPLATLEYLCAALDQLTLHELDRPNKSPETQVLKTRSLKTQSLKTQSLRLVRVNQDQSGKNLSHENFDTFEKLVSQTYHDTLDCPALSEFRSASQTLRAYQDVDSYDPSRWYFVVSEDDPSVSVGCVIMATHSDKNDGKDDVKDSNKRSGNDDAGKNVPTSELVYMALLPEKRRQGLGRALVKLALSEPLSRFGSQISSVSKPPQIVLAVDQQNAHARQLYLDAGFRPLLYENVWGKSVGDTLSTTT